MAVSPCAQTPRPCTGPGDCAACGAGWSCAGGRCVAGQSGPAPPPTIQQVNPPRPQVARQAVGQQAIPPVNPLACANFNGDCSTFNCNHDRLEGYCDSGTNSCKCRTKRTNPTDPDPEPAHLCRGSDTSGCGDFSCPEAGDPAGHTEIWCNGGTCDCRAPSGQPPAGGTTKTVGQVCTPQDTCTCSTSTDTAACTNNVCTCTPQVVTPDCSTHQCGAGQEAFLNTATNQCDCRVTQSVCQNDGACSGHSCGAGQEPYCNKNTGSWNQCQCRPTTVTPDCTASDTSRCAACPGGQSKTCTNGECGCSGGGTVTPGSVAPGGTCSRNSDCDNSTCNGEPAVCTSNTCECVTTDDGGTDCNQELKSCQSSSDCSDCTGSGAPNGWYCTGTPKYCRPRPGASSCTSDSQCRARNSEYPYCSGNSCVQCKNDGHCAGNKECDSGACVDPGNGPNGPNDPENPVPECQSDGDCTSAPKTKCNTRTQRCYDPSGPKPGESCTDNGQCQEGEYCFGGRCTPQVTGGTGGIPRPGPLNLPVQGDPPTPPTITPFDRQGVQLAARTTLPGTEISTGEARPRPEIEITPEQLRATPGYEARFQEGMRARAAAMNASGMLASGDAVKAFERYAQDFASREYEKAYQRKVDEYARQDEREKDIYRRKVEKYNRDLNTVLTENRLRAEDFQRLLAAHGANRADLLAQFGMSQQQFNAMLEKIRTQLDISEAEWGRWLSVWTIQQGNLRGLLGLT